MYENQCSIITSHRLKKTRHASSCWFVIFNKKIIKAWTTIIHIVICMFYTNQRFLNMHKKRVRGRHSTTYGERLLVTESAQACIVVTRYDYKIDFLFVMCFAGWFFWCLFAKEKKILFMYHAFLTFFGTLRAHKPLIQIRSSNHSIRIHSK